MSELDTDLSLFGTPSPEEPAKLGVVHARFAAHSRSSFEGLISGYSSMRVLTYSNSVSVIVRAAEVLDRMEIVFGCEDVIGGMAAYLQFQEQLIKDLKAEIRGKDIVERKISSGEVRLFVVKETAINHEKLFLLEGERGTRVITGSANFSERALSGKQNESYICFDGDHEAWRYFEAKYEKIKANSTMTISRRAVLAEDNGPENLPLLSFDEASDRVSDPIVVTTGRQPEPSVVHKVVAPRRSRKYEGIGQAIPARNGRASIDPQTAAKAIRYIKSSSRSKDENPEEYLSVHLETGRIVVSGRTLDLEPAKSEVARDAALLVEYFRGYGDFRGEAEKLARDYFTFMSWLYAGPFLCDLRSAALARDEHTLDLPVFGILYGKSNCGKSELVRTLLVSMFQREGFLPNDWFTRTQVYGLRVQNRRYPLAFDDLDRTRFNNHAIPLIKEDYIPVEEYPVTVLSTNADQDSFGAEIRKRALILYTNASLPDHVGESRRLANDIRRIRRDLGDALYREYARRALDTLRRERPRDVLSFSSKILSDLLAEHVEETPFWCRTTSMEEYSRSKHDKIKDELLELMRYDPDAWSREGNKIVLRLNDLRKLKKDVPDWLIASGSSGNALVFDAEQLEEFLGDLPVRKNGFPGLLARLFMGRK